MQTCELTRSAECPTLRCQGMLARHQQDVAIHAVTLPRSLVGRRSVLLGGGAYGAGIGGPPATRASATMPVERLPGTFADGAPHPLSARFKTLVEAQAAYPRATDLADEADWCALQGAIDAAASRGGGTIHVPNTGLRYILNRPLVINPNLVTLVGGGAVLDFGSLLDARSAILFKADGAQAYGHERHVFEGFEILGPGRGPGLAGLLLETATEGLSSRAEIRDCVVHAFSTGILFGDRAYGIGFSHCSIYDCATCVFAPAGLRDAGESVSFSQCYLFNAECLLANPGAFDLRLIGCSLDYTRFLINDNAGVIDLLGCRLEISPPRAAPIRCIGGGRVNMFGGFFLINGDSGSVFADELFALDHEASSINLFAISGWNWRTTTGRLTRGPGKIYWHQGNEINAPPGTIHHP